MVLSHEALIDKSASLESLGERHHVTFMETASLEHRMDETLSNAGWIAVTMQHRSHTEPALVT